MKRYDDFRGRPTGIEYDATAGEFVEVAAPHPFTSMQDMPPERPAETATSKLQVDSHSKPVLGIDELGWDMFSSICAYIKTNPTPISVELPTSRRRVNKDLQVYYIDRGNYVNNAKVTHLESKLKKQF